jgi:hypothetical protein
MFDIVKDCYNSYDEKLKSVKLKDLSAIYIKPNAKGDFLFFERFNDFWTYETKDGKYDYKIDLESTVEDLIEQLKNSYEFSDDYFTIRVYDFINNDENHPNFIKLIIPGNRKLMDQEIFGNYELNRLKELNEEINKEDSEELEKFLTQMTILSSDVSQIVRLISSQAHTNETLRFTMNLVSSILGNIPITAITDLDISEKDWIAYEEISRNDKIKEYLELEDHEITDMFVNIRCTRILKVVYKNTENEETFTDYFDIHSKIFVNENDHKAYFNKESIENITLPWTFTPTNEVSITDETKKEDMIPLEEVSI